MINRRRFATLATATAATIVADRTVYADDVVGDQAEDHVIGSNVYPMKTFADRRGDDDFQIDGPEPFETLSRAGVTAAEPLIDRPDQTEAVISYARKRNLALPTVYVNSVLHDEARVDSSVADVIEIAEAFAAAGTKILVTNPSPIRWGGDEDKSDRQLSIQREAIDHLGTRLKRIGVTLAYHNHDAELRRGGREYHHMLTATDGDVVKYCLDAHWVYRGCGNSVLAVMDAVDHYADRVVEMHLRQSVGGTWTEAFAVEGDLDYRRIRDVLDVRGIDPAMVLEQAVESETPVTLDVVEATRRGRQAVANWVGSGG